MGRAGGVRLVLILIILVFTAWAIPPGAAEAHGTANDVTMAGTCAGCDDPARHTDHQIAPDCHHGIACAPSGLPATSAAIGPMPGLTRADRPEHQALPRSITLARDLPPPRG